MSIGINETFTSWKFGTLVSETYFWEGNVRYVANYREDNSLTIRKDTAHLNKRRLVVELTTQFWGGWAKGAVTAAAGHPGGIETFAVNTKEGNLLGYIYLGEIPGHPGNPGVPFVTINTDTGEPSYHK